MALGFEEEDGFGERGIARSDSRSGLGWLWFGLAWFLGWVRGERGEGALGFRGKF